jgi:HEAT repeat protein
MKRLSHPVGRSLTVEELIERLKAPHLSDRSSAASELGRYYYDPCVVVPLIQALDDPDPVVRSAAADSLGKTGRVPAVASTAKQAVQRLIALLEDEDEQVVASAIYALGELGDSGVGSKLLPFLDYPDRPHVKMRNVVIQALCSLRYEPAVPHFRRLLHDASASIRSDALVTLWSLRRHFDIDIREILNSLLDDPSPLLRQRAQVMLTVLTDEEQSE